MSHQDRMSNIVVNHQTIKQVVDWLFVPALFAGMTVRSGATWKPRMLATAALLWACSDLANLTDRFEQARKIVQKVFRWHAPSGETYQGFMKVLRKWHLKLQLLMIPAVRLRRIGDSHLPTTRIGGRIGDRGRIGESGESGTAIFPRHGGESGGRIGDSHLPTTRTRIGDGTNRGQPSSTNRGQPSEKPFFVPSSGSL